MQTQSIKSDIYIYVCISLISKSRLLIYPFFNSDFTQYIYIPAKVHKLAIIHDSKMLVTNFALKQIN